MRGPSGIGGEGFWKEWKEGIEQGRGKYGGESAYGEMIDDATGGCNVRDFLGLLEC
jgi:hypothetical protein